MKNKIFLYLPGLFILFFNYKMALIYSMIVFLYFFLIENPNFYKKESEIISFKIIYFSND